VKLENADLKSLSKKLRAYVAAMLEKPRERQNLDILYAVMLLTVV